MPVKQLSRCCACACLVLLACCRAAVAADEADKSAPPNIILIMADNLGYGDLGCYGQRAIQTPHLDQMASEGLRFTQFYSGAPICASSRCVLMTGIHSGHCRIRGNHRDSDIQALLPEDVTIAEVLKPLGYRTAVIGKWGLGDEGNAGVPNRQGFDFFFGYLNQVHAHNYYPDFLWRNETRQQLANEVVHPKKLYQAPELAGAATRRVDYAPDLMTDEALKFIRVSRDKPFFVYLPYNYPHPNCESWILKRHGAEVPDYGVYADRSWPEIEKGYAAMITRMDRDIGRILALLGELDIDNHTLVLFTSDNGPHSGDGVNPDFHDSNGPLRGALRDLYEGGLRVPLIVRWPGHTPAHRVTDHVASAVDMLATLADVAGAQPRPSDGISLLPVIEGRDEEQRQHDYLYWEFYERGSAQAIRQGDWKAICRPMLDGRIELYNLADDPAEKRNVAKEHPDLVAKLRETMQRSHTPSKFWKPPAAKQGKP